MAPFSDIISVLESAKVYYWDVFEFEEEGNTLWYSSDGVEMVWVKEHEAMRMTSAELAELEMVLTFGCYCN
jgi:hypothetical protein